MHTFQPEKLTTDELIKYGQFYLDRKEDMPQTWQQEVVNRLDAAEAREHRLNTTQHT